MSKKKKHPCEPEKVNQQINSDDISQDTKYIKKLDLQRLILHKLLDGNKNIINKNTNLNNSNSN